MKQQLESLVAQMDDGGIIYSEAVREFKKRFLLRVMARNHNNQSKSARDLGMHRNTLSRTIQELNLSAAIEIQTAQRKTVSRYVPVLQREQIPHTGTSS